MRTAAIVAACLLVPLVWGTLATAIFRRLDRRRARSARPEDPGPADYHI